MYAIRSYYAQVALATATAAWIVLSVYGMCPAAGPEIFLREEPETYLVIDKLEGMGFLKGLMIV